eukprot:8138214-Pyramimonas_sp.AAC.1
MEEHAHSVPPRRRRHPGPRIMTERNARRAATKPAAPEKWAAVRTLPRPRDWLDKLAPQTQQRTQQGNEAAPASRLAEQNEAGLAAIQRPRVQPLTRHEEMPGPPVRRQTPGAATLG